MCQKTTEHATGRTDLSRLSLRLEIEVEGILLKGTEQLISTFLREFALIEDIPIANIDRVNNASRYRIIKRKRC